MSKRFVTLGVGRVENLWPPAASGSPSRIPIRSVVAPGGQFSLAPLSLPVQQRPAGRTEGKLRGAELQLDAPLYKGIFS